MENKIVIRKMQPQDVEAYLKLTDLVWRDAYKNIFPEQVFCERENSLKQRIENFVNEFDENNQIMYVAQVDEQLIGYIYGSLTSIYSHYAQKGYADLLAIYIHPEYQGKGIASKLKTLFIDWLKQHNINKFVIGVLEQNTKARSVYEKWGAVLDNFKQPFVKHGKNYAEVFYICDF